MVDWTRCRQVCQHPINERALSNRHVYARFLNILAQVVAPCATQCGALFDRLAMARERLSADGHDTLMGLLRAGDPHREVWFAWNANEVVCQIYDHADRHLAIEWVDEIVRDFVDREMPVEVRRLGRTIGRWRTQITAWHRCRVSNGPTEAINNLVKRVKRVAFGFRRFDHYRTRALLYAGRPNWTLLNTMTPP